MVPFWLIFDGFWMDCSLIFDIFQDCWWFLGPSTLHFCRFSVAFRRRFLRSRFRLALVQILPRSPRSAKVPPRSRQDLPIPRWSTTAPTLLAPNQTTQFEKRVTDRQAPNEGAAVSRRMASSIRSGPGGARGVFESKVVFPTFCFSSLGFILFIYFI